MTSLTARVSRALERFAGRPVYPALLAGVAAADYFVPGAPSNAILVAAVQPRPDRWKTLGIAFAAGGAFGALLLATLLERLGPPIVAWVQRSEAADLWARIAGAVDAYGLLVLATLAATALPVRIAVAVLALGGTAPWLLGGIVLLGRLVAYPAVAWMAGPGTRVLARRWRGGHRAPAPDPAGTAPLPRAPRAREAEP
jgi:multidrug transporter EmrE-like cation transporter